MRPEDDVVRDHRRRGHHDGNLVFVGGLSGVFGGARGGGEEAMTGDLVRRLLGAIDEREAVAREAAKYSAEEWTTASSAVLDLGLPDLDGLIPLPASPIGHHMEANDPRAVLRLCQSHRDVIKHCVPDLDGSGGPNAQALAEDVLSSLARGYGLEDQ